MFEVYNLTSKEGMDGIKRKDKNRDGTPTEPRCMHVIYS